MLFFTFFPYNRFLFCSHIHWMNLPLNFAIGIALKFVPSTNKCALFSYYIFGVSARVWFKPLAARCDEYFFYIYMKKSNPKFIAFNWCLSCKIPLNTHLFILRLQVRLCLTPMEPVERTSSISDRMFVWEKKTWTVFHCIYSRFNSVFNWNGFAETKARRD